MAEWVLPEAFDFDGRTVRYAVRGTGPPLVVVHGTPWSSFNLRHIIQALSDEYTVYCYDLVGYGRSSKQAGDVSLGIQNELLVRLLEHWKLTAPAIVGHDFGGATLLRAHLINQQAFDRIVLIDPVAVSPWGSAFFRHVAAHEAAFAGVPDYIHEALLRAYINTAAVRPIREEVLRATIAPWLEADGKEAFYRQIAQADPVHTDAVQPLYGEITRPVLVLWGREDTWIPVERGRMLCGLIPGATLKVIANAGHLVIEEEPERLAAEIRDFLGAPTDA